MLQQKTDVVNRVERLEFTNEAVDVVNTIPERSKSLPAAVVSKGTFNGGRSTSNAGLPQHLSNTSPNKTEAQTAPATSTNCYGFAYPYNYPFLNSLGYSNNNPMVATAAVTNNVDQNLLFQPMQNGYMRSISPLPVVMPPTAEGTIPKPSADSRSTSSRSPQPVVPPRPAGYNNSAGTTVQRPYMYMPLTPVSTSSLSGSRRTPSDVQSPVRSPPTISESPENSASFHLDVDQSSQTLRNDVNSQLYINIEQDDTSSHGWRPFHSHSPHGHPLIQQIPFQLSTGFNNYQPMFQHSDGSVDQGQVIMQPQPLYMPIPYPPMAYPQNFYYQVPTSGQLVFPSFDMNIQQYVYQQTQNLNSLQCELNRDKEDIQAVTKEIEDLQKSLKENSFLPKKAEIDKLNTEISKLSLECYCLCAEVDQHYDGRAPLGEIKKDFYSCINTGQDGPIHSDSRKTGHTEAEYPAGFKVPSDEEEENEEKSNWTCSECTFRNHPAINICEVCQIGKNIACS